MKPQRSPWLCPTELDRMRVVEASDRVRRARITIWVTIGVALIASAPWQGWWTLLLFAPAGFVLGGLEVGLRRTDHPERLAMAAMLIILGLFAAGIALSGGPRSPVLTYIIIPVAVAPMRFRGPVVAALAGLTVVALLAVTVGVDPAAALDDPSAIIATIALLISVSLANWALVEAEMKQRDAAVLDPLTGLLNRKALEARALELEQQARFTGDSVALIACDLDRFKDVNDNHGHDRGDAVLRSFAYQVRKALRSFELIYRLGGEEFLIVLPGADLEEGVQVAERLRKAVEESRPGGLPVTCSFGVSGGAGDQVVYSRLFKAADEALYRAKAGGRNRVCGDEAIAASMPELAPQPVPVA